MDIIHKRTIVEEYFKDNYIKVFLNPTIDKFNEDELIENLYSFIDSELNHPEHFTLLHKSE